MQTLQCTSVDAEVWTSIAPSFADYTYEQSYEYASFMAAKKRALAQFITIQDGERLIAAACVRVKNFPLIGRGLAYIAGGPLMQRRGREWDEAQNQAVLAALRRKLVDEEGHFLYVRLPVSPPAPSLKAQSIFAELGFLPTVRLRSYQTILKNLNGNQRQLRSSLSRKWCRELKLAEQGGLAVEHGSTEAFIGRFLKLYDQMREFKRFSISLDPTTLLRLPPESLGLQVLIATKDGQDLAAHVQSLLGDTAVTLFSATSHLGRTMKAGYQVFWNGMILAQERGFGWYDLAGIDAIANPGGYNFKTKIRGQELAAIGPYEARPSGYLPILMERLISLRDRGALGFNHDPSIRIVSYPRVSDTIAFCDQSSGSVPKM
jgi:lipid II:glycine glycyltransferase (peptidoglycan interpeptide bridge formation enzyme)